MLFVLSLGILSACGNSNGSNGMFANDNSIPGDTIIDIIGEWAEVPVEGQTDMSQPPKKMKLNRDNTMEGVSAIKKVKKSTHKNKKDSVEITTMIYQLWDQEGDTLTFVSQSAIDPQKQDTVSWGIVSLTVDSLQLNNAKQGTKKYVRTK